MSDPNDVLRSALKTAQRITVLTGAGVSAASGVPTFRGGTATSPDPAAAAPLWQRFRPEELATAAAFARDPALVWNWYAWRRDVVARCRPNAAHDVIARWSRRAGCRVVTQNVDDLHLAAGTRDLIRLHGSLWELSCWERCAAGRTPWRDDRTPLPELPPRCPHCGGLARPAVVWFGEGLAPRDLDAALAATHCDIFLTIGTSAVVYPAAGLVEQARHHGAFTVEINLEPTPATALVDLALQGPVEVVLPALG